MPRQVARYNPVWQEQLELLDIPALSVDELSGCPDKFEILHCGWTSKFLFTFKSSPHSRAAVCGFCVTRRRAVPAEAEAVWDSTENYAEGIEREGSVGQASGESRWGCGGVEKVSYSCFRGRAAELSC